LINTAVCIAYLVNIQKRVEEEELEELHAERRELLERKQVALEEEEQLRDELERLRQQEAKADQHLSVSKLEGKLPMPSI
jgi:hypothetical protein